MTPGSAGTAADHFRAPAPHVCTPGPPDPGRRPCCVPIPAPRRTTDEETGRG